MPTVNQMVRQGRKNKKTKSNDSVSESDDVSSAVHLEQFQAAPCTTGQGRAAKTRRMYCCTYDDTQETEFSVTQDRPRAFDKRY